MDTISLPRSLSNLQDQLESNEQLDFPKLLSKSTFSSKNPDSKLIWQFSIPGLRNGRPLDKVVYLLAGEGGSDRSSTINTLFHNNLLSLSKSNDQTSDVSEYIKSLKVTSVAPPLLADLCFIDLPTLEKEEATIGTQKIEEFLRTSTTLQNYPIPPNLQRFKLPNKVYPNLILAFVASSKNDSDLEKELNMLRQHEFVDEHNNNLIIVVTHSASLGSDHETYDKKSEEIKKKIEQSIKNILGVAEVPVVFVENEPHLYNLEKNGDFYLLPNGRMSHANLITEMFKLFNLNGDKLGLLLTSWYFKSDCPDKILVPMRFAVEVGPQFLGSRSISTQQVRICSVPLDNVISSQFHPNSIGYGFCPVTEILKRQNVFDTDTELALQTITVGQSKFQIPTFCKHFVETKTNFQSLSCDTKETYEKSKATQYGMEADVKLLVGVSSAGKWISDIKSSSNSKVISVLYEIRHCSLQIDSPERHISKEFRYALNSLPDSYDPQNPERFNELFSKYGTHLVCKQYLGGWIKCDYTFKSLNYNKDTLSKIEAKTNGWFKYASAGGSFSTEAALKEMCAMGVTNTHIITEGGNNSTTITELSQLTPEVFKMWKESVASDPAPLEHSIELYPFYNLASSHGPISSSLREATKDFLEQRMEARIKSKRDDIANKAYGEAMQEPKGECKCFPGSTLVQTKKGVKRIGELDREDLMATVDKRGQIKWTPFCTWLHVEREKRAKYLALKFDNGKTLQVSKDHLLFIHLLDGDKELVSRKAGDVEIGDMMVYSDEEGVVTMAELVAKEIQQHEGVYCLLTMEGTFLADGFLVTCYADIEDFATAHKVFGPLRLWHWVKGTLGFGIGECDQEKSGIHDYAKVLMKVRIMMSKLGL